MHYETDSDKNYYYEVYHDYVPTTSDLCLTGHFFQS